MFPIILIALLMVYVLEAETEVLSPYIVPVIPQQQQQPKNQQSLTKEKAETVDYIKCGINNYKDESFNANATSAFPWLASFFHQGFHHCFGSIISTTHILTAARCFNGVNSEDAKNLTVRVGVNQLEKQAHQETEERGVKLILKNKNFDSQIQDDNVAIIVLDAPLVFTSNIWPICLAGPDNETCQGQKVNQVGLDMLNRFAFVSKDLVVMSEDECKDFAENKYTFLPIKDPHKMLCAKSKDRCMREGGSPLVYKTPDDIYVQIGIQAWFVGCLIDHSPHMFTRVTAVRDWIDKALKYKKQ